MRMPIVPVAVAGLAALGVSGCGHSTQACGVADYGGRATSGYTTPQQALRSVLARPEQGPSATGWKLNGRSAHAATFTSGNDSVDVVQNKVGKWNVGGLTTCRLPACNTKLITGYTRDGSWWTGRLLRQWGS
jgi:hypothetical protein